MPGTMYQQYFEAQRAMFDAWQKNTASLFSSSGEAGSETNANPMEFYSKMFGTPREVWQKAAESQKSYNAVFDLWKKLSSGKKPMDSKAALQVYDAWLAQSFHLIKSNIAPDLPESFKLFSEKFVENMEHTSKTMSESMKSWAGNEEGFRQAFNNSLGNGPKGYIEFLKVWQKHYGETFGKAMNAPTFGKDMDFWKHQKSSVDQYIQSTIAATKFYTSLIEIAQQATRQVLEDYVGMQAKGTQPETFEEFYKYWSKTVSAAYGKVLFSDDLSVLAGDMVDSMSKFKKDYDKISELYLSNAPFPKKSEMDELYKTVYNLKKEVRALKKELHAGKKGA